MTMTTDKRRSEASGRTDPHHAESTPLSTVIRLTTPELSLAVRPPRGPAKEWNLPQVGGRWRYAMETESGDEVRFRRVTGYSARRGCQHGGLRGAVVPPERRRQRDTEHGHLAEEGREGDDPHPGPSREVRTGSSLLEWKTAYRTPSTARRCERRD